MKKIRNKPYAQSYGKLAVITIIAVYLLILVGGIVRSSGSGMGCPDWPKCFGSWVPPTDESQLPDDYQQLYLEKRLQKNEKLAAMLERLGMRQTAHALRTEELVQQESGFNVTNTWIEYLNRVVGVVIGLLIIGTFIRSLKFWNVKRSITLLSGFALVLVIFQGWLGSIVVSSNLLPWMVTIHMLPALLLVAVLELAYFRAVAENKAYFAKRRHAQTVLWVAMVLTLIQVVLGTQVREAIDAIALAFNYEQRGQWIGQLDTVFYIHRSFSWLLLAAHLYLLYMMVRQQHKELKNWAAALLGVVLLEAAFGLGLAYLDFPAMLQPLHLLGGTLLFGLQYYMLLLVGSHKTIIIEHKLQTC